MKQKNGKRKKKKKGGERTLQRRKKNQKTIPGISKVLESSDARHYDKSMGWKNNEFQL